MGSRDFSNMVSSDANVATFVSTTMTFLQRWGWDGLDLDWEYPSII
jgi:chitinase